MAPEPQISRLRLRAYFQAEKLGVSSGVSEIHGSSPSIVYAVYSPSAVAPGFSCSCRHSSTIVLHLASASSYFLKWPASYRSSSCP
jgi:hypothetical protein